MTLVDPVLIRFYFVQDAAFYCATDDSLTSLSDRRLFQPLRKFSRLNFMLDMNVRN